MATNALKVSTRFKDSDPHSETLGVKVYFSDTDRNFVSNTAVTGTFDPGLPGIINFVPETVKGFSTNSSKLNIDVVHGGETIGRAGFNRNLYIKIDSGSDFAFNIETTDSGWTITKKKSCRFSQEPVFVPMCAKAKNSKLLRFTLLPFELAWFMVKAPVLMVMAVVDHAIKVLLVDDAEPEITNVEVGDDGEG